MATITQKGIAQIQGITGTATISPSPAAYANLTFKTQGAKLTGKNESRFVKDAIGYDNGAVSVNEYIEATLDFNIEADTAAHALASAVILTPLSVITLASFDVAVLNGAWLYVGDMTLDLSNVDIAKTTLPIRKYLDATQNTLMTTTPS